MDGKRFDFRDMIGGAGAQVTPDNDLADGANADGAAGLCAHMTLKQDGVPELVQALANSIVATANFNGLCAGALVALVVERLMLTAAEDVSEAQLVHIAHEVATRMEAHMPESDDDAQI